jgi:tetratricopeptide (TPR) repeat protein
VAEYYGSGVLARPEAYFKEALRIDPGDKMARYYVKQLAEARVELFLRWGDYGEARSYLTELLALMPLDETLAGLLADVEEAAERGARAVEASKEALPGADIEPRHIG